MPSWCACTSQLTECYAVVLRGSSSAAITTAVLLCMFVCSTMLQRANTFVFETEEVEKDHASCLFAQQDSTWGSSGGVARVG